MDGHENGMTRRHLLGVAPAALVAAGATRAIAAAPGTAGGAGGFPQGFLWGAATAAHQVEGNNDNSDIWLLEQMKPTIFTEPSGDACDSLNRWRDDLDIVRALGLNSYRFSLEWARIEPNEGQFSNAMLDHYARMIDGCRERGLKAIVTFNHFTCPRWFSAKGGWTNPASPDLFARYCERAAKRLAGGIDYATTLNEPEILRLLKWLDLPPQVKQAQSAMLAAAARATGSDHFVAANAANPADVDAMLKPMLAAHAKGYAAIKAARPSLPVGVSLAIEDDQAVGPNSRRDEKRSDVYAAWLEAAGAHGDFVGVQNYGRTRLDATGVMAPPPGVVLSQMGVEVYPASLGNVIRYAHEVTRKPIMVTENGIAAEDDMLRQRYIPQVLAGVKGAIDAGVPVLGYVHWSLLDNFEWIFGYRPRFGLVEVDRTTFKRTPKPSARLLGRIAQANAL